jgi:hypothetical protein
MKNKSQILYLAQKIYQWRDTDSLAAQNYIYALQWLTFSNTIAFIFKSPDILIKRKNRKVI